MNISEINRRIDGWWDEEFSSGDTDVKRAADHAAEELAADPEFSRAFTELYARTVVYNRGIDLASRRRSLIRAEGKAIARARPVSLPGIAAPVASASAPTVDASPPVPPASAGAPAAAATASVSLPVVRMLGAPVEMTRSWAEWLERDPETGHHVSFLALNKKKLLQVSRRYQDRASAGLFNGAFTALVAGRLPDDETVRVGDVWTADDLNAAIGNLTLKLGIDVRLAGIGQYTREVAIS